jgi:trigger factor
MSVTIETAGPCRTKLRIEVAPDRVAGVRAEILEEFRKHANIAGFRPGKAPEPMVEKRYAAEIDDELRKRLIPDSYREAVAEHKLHVVGYPDVGEVQYQPGKPLAYTATVDTAPEFALPITKRSRSRRRNGPSPRRTSTRPSSRCATSRRSLAT